tara:strand:- start:106 stop:624 length:519 start_codon:yes stop_codon:yes gene_type:complete
MTKQNPNFEQSMNVAIIWCNLWEAGELSDEVLADRIGELIASKEGARGFFAISLSIDCPLMDRLPDPLIFQLRKAGEKIVSLTVKNLAMSAAMANQHKINKDNNNESNSKRINSRCIEILKLLETNYVKKHLDSLLESTKGRGEYVDFINRWNYTNEQKTSIIQSIYSVAEN